MELFSPDDVAAHVREHAVDTGIQVTWLGVDGPRDEFKDELDGLVQDLPVLVLIVRMRGFDDPNALLADLVELLNDSRQEAEHRLAAFSGETTFHLVLLAKKQLNLAQASSPVTLPSWFPIMPSRSLHAVVRDQTWSLSTSINDPRTGVAELNEAIFRLEGSLLRRMRHMLLEDARSGDALFGQLDDPPAKNFQQCLEMFVKQHKGVSNPAVFRPSVRVGTSLASQIWRIVQTKGTEQIGRPAAGLAGALGISSSNLPMWSAGFPGLLFRSTYPVDGPKAFGRDIILTTGLSCQLSTAAAHADQYPRYPVPLLASFSQSLLDCISNVVHHVDALD